MASVDAAVGGKTGINFNGLKNEVGSFYPPECVFIDCEFLRTLDRDNLLSGYAEMIKHALISSMDIYASVLLFDLDAKIDYAFLNRMVAQSVAVKERIVEEDPKEHGIRTSAIRSVMPTKVCPLRRTVLCCTAMLLPPVLSANCTCLIKYVVSRWRN